jgi:hypothetical protein
MWFDLEPTFYYQTTRERVRLAPLSVRWGQLGQLTPMLSQGSPQQQEQCSCNQHSWISGKNQVA